MSITTLRPLLLTALLLAAGAALAWWGLAPRIAQQAARAEQAERQATERQQLIDLQAGVLAEQQRQIGAVTAIEQRLRALNQTVTRNAAQQRAALEELKRNDQAVADYLATAVPAGLGRLYQRPETVDPAAYRGADPLPLGPMPPARPPGAGGD